LGGGDSSFFKGRELPLSEQKYTEFKKKSFPEPASQIQSNLVLIILG
jgi:hypothetical protein